MSASRQKASGSGIRCGRSGAKCSSYFVERAAAPRPPSLIDSRRRDMRQLVGTILFEQAVTAERDLSQAQRDDLFCSAWALRHRR